MSNPNLPDPIRKIVQEERALAIVRILHAAPAMVANDSLLQKCVQAYGLTCGQDELRAELGRLERDGLMSSERKDNLLVVQLTKRGAEVAQGLIVVEGVARPDPGCSY